MALARFYGLPEVHKEGVPLRPIVSLKGTSTYGLAKWLFRRLNFLISDSDTTVCSSTQFLEKFKGDLAIETVELLLRSKYNETENRLGHVQVLQPLKFYLRTYFTFDRTIYEQVKGTPMGSLISGFIAETVLQRLESLVFQHHRPKFWARYVDDTFVVIERDQVLTFKERLSSVFPDIQFTMEEEKITSWHSLMSFLLFSATLTDAHRDERFEIRIDYRTDGHLLNQRRTKAPRPLSTTTVHDWLLADDCALSSTTEVDMQRSVDLSASGCAHFGLPINTDKTVVMHQQLRVRVNGTKITSENNFNYLGGATSRCTRKANEESHRVFKANQACEWLQNCL
nr:unnamed protein product [Spirometra erinaceieuropaei]